MTSSVDEVSAALALAHLDDASWAALARDVRDRKSAALVLEERGHFQGDLFGESSEITTGTEGVIRCFRTMLDQVGDRGVFAMAISDEDFPTRVAGLKSPPLFLFARGRLDGMDKDGVAIIGSRRVSPTSLGLAREWSKEIAQSGTVVISGLAAGIDREAHLGALDIGARTVAVIGTGILRAYPKENAALRERIAAEGLVVSQFLPDAAPSKTSFPMRNAVMAAWGHATLVIDADDRSGASLQARLAVEQGSRLLLHEQLRIQSWATKLVDAGHATFVSDPAQVRSAS